VGGFGRWLVTLLPAVTPRSILVRNLFSVAGCAVQGEVGVDRFRSIRS
jgi:hypothetical protein